jgi:hypothetical protein
MKKVMNMTKKPKAQEKVRTMINSRSTKKCDDYDHEHNEGGCVQKKATNMIGNNCRNTKKGTDHD